MAVQIARSTVFPGDYTYVWSYQANLLSAYSLHNDTLGNFPLVQVTLATRGLATWDVSYHTGLLLPSPIPGNLQGVFQLWNGPDQQNQAPLSPAVNIRILPPADDLTTLTTTLSPQQPGSQVDDAPRIQIALQNYRLWGDSTAGPAVANQAVITNFANNNVDYQDQPPPNPPTGTVKIARLLDGWTAHD
jgi:hypothetical protein